MSRKKSVLNLLYASLIISIIIVFFIVFTKVINFLGREIISLILIIFVYVGFIKVSKDNEGKWSFLVIMKAIGTATFFILIATFFIWYIRNSDCDFNILNRFCI